MKFSDFKKGDYVIRTDNKPGTRSYCYDFVRVATEGTTCKIVSGNLGIAINDILGKDFLNGTEWVNFEQFMSNFKREYKIYKRGQDDYQILIGTSCGKKIVIIPSVIDMFLSLVDIGQKEYDLMNSKNEITKEDMLSNLNLDDIRAQKHIKSYNIGVNTFKQITKRLEHELITDEELKAYLSYQLLKHIDPGYNKLYMKETAEIRSNSHRHNDHGYEI